MGHLAYVTECFSESKTIALGLKWVHNSWDFSIRYYNPQFVPETQRIRNNRLSVICIDR